MVALAGVVGVAVVVVPTVGRPQGQPGQQRYEAAEARFAAGDAAGALALLDELAAEFPRSRYPQSPWRAAAGARAGEIELARGRPDAAAARFVAVVDAEVPSMWTSRAALGLATTLMWDRQWAAAAAWLQHVVDANSEGGPAADPVAAGRAAARLSLLYRVWLRVAAGERPWQRSGRFDAGTTLDRPIGVAAGSDGVLITDEGLDAAVFVDARGNAATFNVVDPYRPWWSYRGDAFVAAKSSVSAPLRVESLQFTYSDGSRQRQVRDIRAGARASTGAWLLIDDGSHRLLRFAADGAFERVLDLGRDGEPVDVAIGPRGRIFVIEKRRREVVVLEADGGLRGGFNIDGWRQPYALATDAVGHVYVLDRDLKRVDVLDPDGGILWTVGPVLPGGLELDDPRDLAVDAGGRILVADRGLSAVVVIE